MTQGRVRVTELRVDSVPRVDWLLPAIAVGATVVYVAHGFGGNLDLDRSLLAYAGQMVADGRLPYEGVYNRSGPISHLVPGAGIALGRLVGFGDVFSARLINLVLSVLSVLVAYQWGKEQLRSRTLGAATASALLFIEGFADYASYGPRDKTAMVLFLFLAAWMTTRRRFFWVGVFVSLATLTWQPAFFFGAAAAVVALWALPRLHRGRAFAGFIVGGLIPLAFFVALYAAAGRLQLFLDCFVLIHADYTNQSGFFKSPVWGLRVLARGYDLSLLVLVVGSLGILALAARYLWSRGHRADPDRRIEIAFAAALVAGMLWCLRAFNGWPDVFFLFPSCVLGAGMLVRLAFEHYRQETAQRIALGWIAVCTIGALVTSVATREDTLARQQANVDAVLAELPADASIVSIQAPQALVLSGKTDAFPHQMFSSGMAAYVDATWPGGLDGFSKDIADSRPTLLAVGKGHWEWLDPLLGGQYAAVGRTTSWTWYARRDLGPAVLNRLREANASHPVGSPRHARVPSTPRHARPAG